MEFRIHKKENENIHKYPTDDLKLAQNFSQQLKNELGDFLIGIALFGSAVRRETSPESDIDILVISDDVSFQITDALIESYRLIVEKIIAKTSPKLHVTSMTYTSFWEYVKAGDPVVVNILRDGVTLIDTGFFEPLQVLLKQGRIRPSEESVWRYLMRKNEVPPTPEHVADLLEKVYVKSHLLEQKYVEIMRKFYRLSKMITHREIRQIHGPEYEKYYIEAEEFVKRMKILVEKGKF